MTTFARFEIDGTVLHGIVEGHAIKEISGSPLNDYSETGNSHNLQDLLSLPARLWLLA